MKGDEPGVKVLPNKITKLNFLSVSGFAFVSLCARAWVGTCVCGCICVVCSMSVRRMARRKRVSWSARGSSFSCQTQIEADCQKC